jgi:hypothetical protein
LKIDKKKEEKKIGKENEEMPQYQLKKKQEKKKIKNNYFQ